jgi:glycosyltransferase involved in cell wall biosynthesis
MVDADHLVEILYMDPEVSETAHPPTPRVSVLLPTYNRERLLPEAIRSVLAQTFADFELIVVDDGSTDSTPALVAAIEDPRVRYFARTHGGLSAALNTGLQHARGEYIARIDSDDLLLPDAIASLVAELDRNPEAGFIWARALWMSPDGRDLPRMRGGAGEFRGDLLRSLIYDDCTSGQAMLTRRACFERAGPYDETLTASIDWDMALRLARHAGARFLDRIVVRVREHDDSMTGRTSPQHATFLATRARPLDKLFADPNLPAEIAAMKPVAYANVHIFCGRRWLSRRDFRNAAREFARAITVSGRPLSTALTIAWRAVILQILDRSAAGRRMAAALERIAPRRG